MTDLGMTLPKAVEQGAIRTDTYEVEIVETDGGSEVRNLRHARNKRRYEVSFPTSKRDDATYLAVLRLWAAAKGKLYSFQFTDWSDGTTVAVRFDSELRITGIDRNLDHIETLTIVEVFQ